MIYYLHRHTSGKGKRIAISEEEYNDLVLAANTIRIFCEFTENYRVVIENYRSIEKAKHDAELDNILYYRFEYEDFSDVRVALSAPIIGYLASARYFLDSSDKIIPEILSESQIESYKNFCHSIYDASCEYRFIEALRNYVQHRNLPIHSITYQNYLEDQDNIKESDMVTTLSLHANQEKLRRDKKFKKAALENMPELIDIIYCIRFHLEGIWKLYDYISKSHSDIAENARILVSNSIDRLVNKSDNASLIVHVVSAKQDGEQIEKTPLLLVWDNARIATQKRIGNLINLHKHYITGKIYKA